jgi:CheY-like chemotaxis protein
LGELGHQVLEAEDGPSALRLLTRPAHLDLLVTDVGLPNGLNGLQVADAAREHWPGLPVLFITGYVDDALNGQLAPGMQVIGKPFRLDELAVRIAAMLRTPADMQAL